MVKLTPFFFIFDGGTYSVLILPTASATLYVRDSPDDEKARVTPESHRMRMTEAVHKFGFNYLEGPNFTTYSSYSQIYIFWVGRGTICVASLPSIR